MFSSPAPDGFGGGDVPASFFVSFFTLKTDMLKKFEFRAVLFVVWTLVFCSAGVAQTERLFIGTYTGGENGGRGIYTCRFDAEKGTFTEPELAASCDNPSFLVLHPTNPRLYAVGGKGRSGLLYAFRYAKSSGRLTPLDEKEIPGGGPCHLAMCFSEQDDLYAVVVANYNAGNVLSFPLFESGKVGKVASTMKHAGFGPNAARQKEPHPHGVYFDLADSKTVAVPDLGIDKVAYYEIDLRSARLTPKASRPFLHLPPGGGPRHLAASKDGRFVYVNNELTSTVCVFDLAGKDPFRSVQEISTLPEDVDASNNSTAEIELSSSGRHLYVSNRGHDSIAVYAVDHESGMLELIQNAPCGGVRPRFFTLVPSGRFLLSCNKESGTVTVLAVNSETGTLTPTDEKIEVPRPVCIVFAR